jgi:hypothetical protein
MRAHRAIVALVIINLVLLTVQLAHARPVSPDPIAPVLRGRALELVDERGRVRAEIKVLPAEPNVKMPDGTTGMPETVQLRLINSAGSPHVKLVAPEDGSALVLGGERGAYVQIRSRGTDPTVKIHHSDGRESVIDR